MAAIPHLPPEILSNIMGFVTDQSSFYSLCLTSRSFNALATPYLYSKFDDTPSTPKSLTRPQRIHRLLKTLSIYPSRSTYLKSIRAHVWRRSPSSLPLSTDPALSAFLTSTITSLFSSFDTDARTRAETEHDFLLQLNSSSSSDPLLALLIALSPKLTTLSIIPNYFIYLPAATHSSFKHLKSLTLGQWGDGDGFRLHHLPQFLGLQNLTELHCHQLRDILFRTQDSPFRDIPSKSSSITHLSLTRSFLTSPAIDELLRLPRALHNFELELGKPILGLPGNSSVFDAIALDSALNTHHRTTLQSLTISMPNFSNDAEYRPAGDDFPLGDISYFEALRVLDVPLGILVPDVADLAAAYCQAGSYVKSAGKENDYESENKGEVMKQGLHERLLPGCIESVRLRECDDMAEGLVRTWAEVKREGRQFKSLRKISLVYCKRRVRERNVPRKRKVNRPDLDELHNLCDDVGIRLDVDY